MKRQKGAEFLANYIQSRQTNDPAERIITLGDLNAFQFNDGFADVIDTILFLVTNEGLTTGDHVNGNDVPFRDTFPFFAASHQPLDSGVIDDNTRN